MSFYLEEKMSTASALPPSDPFLYTEQSNKSTSNNTLNSTSLQNAYTSGKTKVEIF